MCFLPDGQAVPDYSLSAMIRPDVLRSTIDQLVFTGVAENVRISYAVNFPMLMRVLLDAGG